MGYPRTTTTVPPVESPPDRTHDSQATRTKPHVVGGKPSPARAVERPMMPFPGIEPADRILPIAVAVVEVPVLSGTRLIWPEGVSLAVASEGSLVEGA